MSWWGRWAISSDFIFAPPLRFDGRNSSPAHGEMHCDKGVRRLSAHDPECSQLLNSVASTPLSTPEREEGERDSVSTEDLLIAGPASTRLVATLSWRESPQ
jgi:hypothetical protein